MKLPSIWQLGKLLRINVGVLGFNPADGIQADVKRCVALRPGYRGPVSNGVICYRENLADVAAMGQSSSFLIEFVLHYLKARIPHGFSLRLSCLGAPFPQFADVATASSGLFQ